MMPRIFISYKARNANVARALSEALEAQGIDTWLNESAILSEEYDAFNEGLPENLVRMAGGCSHGLLLVNAEWEGSEYCRAEARGLREAGLPTLAIAVPSGPADRVAVLPPESTETYSANPLVADQEEVRRLVEWLCGRWGFSVDPGRMAPSVSRGGTLTLRMYGLSLDLGPFRTSIAGTRALQNLIQHSLFFEGKVGRQDVRGHLVVMPFNSALGQLSVGWEENIDDREIWNRYRRFASRWYRDHWGTLGSSTRKRLQDVDTKTALAEKGLHLIFVGNKSHMAMTYTSEELSGGGRKWERRYAIAFKGDIPGESGEIDLVFGTSLRGSPMEQRAAFARLTPQFDLIATSIRRIAPSAAQAVFNTLPRLVCDVGWMAGAVGALVHFWENGGNPWILLGLGLFGGVMLADVVVTLGSPLYRRFLWSLTPLIDDLTSQDAYTRLSMNLFQGVISAPLSVLFGAMAAVLKYRSVSNFFPLAMVAALGFMLVSPDPVMSRLGSDVPFPAVVVAIAALAGVVWHGNGVRLLLQSLRSRSVSPDSA